MIYYIQYILTFLCRTYFRHSHSVSVVFYIIKKDHIRVRENRPL